MFASSWTPPLATLLTKRAISCGLAACMTFLPLLVLVTFPQVLYSLVAKPQPQTFRTTIDLIAQASVEGVIAASPCILSVANQSTELVCTIHGLSFEYRYTIRGGRNRSSKVMMQDCCCSRLLLNVCQWYHVKQISWNYTAHRPRGFFLFLSLLHESKVVRWWLSISFLSRGNQITAWWSDVARLWMISDFKH